MIYSSSLFDLSHSKAGRDIASCRYPHEILDKIRDLVLYYGENAPASEYEEISAHVWVARDVTVPSSAFLGEYVFIDHGCEIRHSAFLRGNVLSGCEVVIGNSVEIKNSIIFDGAEIPHFNYVGDSVLGYKSHMGAGSITSNVRADKKDVVISTDEGKVETHRMKVGAFLGDRAEIGCNAVLNPGTVIGKGSRVYPLTSVRGYVPEKSIIKNNGSIAPIL